MNFWSKISYTKTFVYKKGQIVLVPIIMILSSSENTKNFEFQQKLPVVASVDYAENVNQDFDFQHFKSFGFSLKFFR